MNVIFLVCLVFTGADRSEGRSLYFVRITTATLKTPVSWLPSANGWHTANTLEMSSSDHWWIICHTDWICLLLPVRCRTITSQRSLPLPVKSFPFHQSFYPSTPCTVKQQKSLRRGWDLSNAFCAVFCRLRCGISHMAASRQGSHAMNCLCVWGRPDLWRIESDCESALQRQKP